MSTNTANTSPNVQSTAENKKNTGGFLSMLGFGSTPATVVSGGRRKNRNKSRKDKNKSRKNRNKSRKDKNKSRKNRNKSRKNRNRK